MSQPLLHRGLAVAVALVAAAGIVSAGLVSSPVLAEAAVERAKVVHSPTAHRVISAAASEPVVEPAGEPVVEPAGEPVVPAAEPPVVPDAPPAPAPAPADPAPAPAPVEAQPAPVAPPAPAPAPAPAPTAPAAAVRTDGRDAECETSMLRWMNESRASAGRQALRRDDAILHVAVDWSHAMADRGQLAHNPRYGDQVFAVRAEAMTAAENVGWGTDTARAVYDEFLRSPAHADKILSGALTHAAVGCVRDGAGALWVTVNFWG